LTPAHCDGNAFQWFFSGVQIFIKVVGYLEFTACRSVEHQYGFLHPQCYLLLSYFVEYDRVIRKYQVGEDRLRIAFKLRHPSVIAVSAYDPCLVLENRLVPGMIFALAGDFIDDEQPFFEICRKPVWIDMLPR
jgi:hypothetical protein